MSAFTRKPIPKSATGVAGSLSMRCPQCGGPSNVVDSRPSGGSLRRRRVCRSCDLRFTTFEQIEGDRLEPSDKAALTAIRNRLLEITIDIAALMEAAA